MAPQGILPSFFTAGRIPLDILSEIVVHWALSDSDAPWKASVVCHLWRSAVLSTPNAWSRVNICFPMLKKTRRRKIGTKNHNKEKDSEFESQSNAANADLESAAESESESSAELEDDDDDEDPSQEKPRPLGLWLSRARQSDLFIRMKLGFSPRIDFVYPAIQDLVEHFPKIKELVLDDDSYLLSLNQLLDMFGPAPALEHLTLSIIKHREELGPTEELTIVKGFWNFLKQTPRLRSLKLSKCLLGPMPPATGPQLHLKLRSLSLDGAHLFGLHTVLKTIQPFLCLEELAFTSSVPCLIRSNAGVHPITLPTLVTLAIDDDINILANFTVPKLRSLILDKYLSKDDKRSLPGLLSNLFERGTDLRSLTISFAPITKDKFVQIFQHIPLLEILEFRDCSVDMQSLIHSTTSHHPLCPQLHTLRLYSSHLADGASLLELVVVRKQSTHCRTITTLRIGDCKYIDLWDVQRIRTAGGPYLDVEYNESQD
ncbi:hypothetical protein B0H16DRAFT_1596854 [Mycena metata]|uniref:F-box domain-containing protein n=1 Tax=Mycena metata TaxID=1033252 RepID=A0AAD7HMP0_9AGAR|nr:hypothetical protein B0H16DRAFT_1596854 [Mycena metata]